MKVFCFHLMPYAHLDMSYSEKYRAAWVVLPNTYFDPKKGHELYNRYLDELELVAELGYDGISVNEHHQNAYGLMPSPVVTAAALARRTKSAKIGVIGLNGAGKSTLLRIMGGIEKDFTGEAWAADGVRVGFLPQEPELDPALNILGNVMESVAEKKALLERYNEIAANYSDETAEEMAALQDKIKGASLATLADCAHLPHIEQPRAFAEEVTRFIRRAAP